MSGSIWGLFLVVNCMKLFLSNFSDSLLAFNHWLKDLNSFSLSLLKSLGSELVNIILLSSGNTIGLDFPFIIFDKSFV
jgi:hypothetical protein